MENNESQSRDDEVERSPFLTAEGAHECHVAMGLRFCEYDIVYKDYDGTFASHECGAPASHQVVVHDEEGEYIVQSCTKHHEEWAS